MTIPPSPQQETRTHRITRQYGAAVVLAVLMLFAAAMVALIVSVAGGDSDESTPSGTRIVADRVNLTSLDPPVGGDRPIYRHSVVPGGVYTPDEFKNVLVQDAIAATHYKGFNPNKARVETVKQDRFAYVSYRKNDQIYWTRNKVKLSQGETILTDGTSEIRARCGNCISETPRLPVAEIEPASAEFDQFLDSGDPSLSAAVRAALASPSLSSGPGSVSPAAAGQRASSSPGGAGGSGRPSALASQGPSAGGPAGSGGGSASQPADSPLSPLITSTSASGSPAASPVVDPASVRDSSGASVQSTSDAPGTQLSAREPGPAAAGIPAIASTGSPLTLGSPGPGNLPAVPPGIDLPPGYDPAAGIEPSSSRAASSAVGPPDGSGDDPEGAALPEPGMLLLLGGGAAAALVRKLRSRS